MNFDEWYHDEWIKHIADSGGIKAQIKLLTWMVGGLLTANVTIIIALVGWLVLKSA